MKFPTKLHAFVYRIVLLEKCNEVKQQGLVISGVTLDTMAACD